MGRYDLSEAEWRLVEPLLPPSGRGKARIDNRRVVNGTFYVLRTGSPWRDLPERYGPYTTVYTGLTAGRNEACGWRCSRRWPHARPSRCI